jgi:pyridinium-3,5-bisthiocarboxylic acid mononucleotide nickel chelatase
MLAYLDCFSGIAGDMTLAALIDLGLDTSALESELALLKLSGYSIRVSHETRRGIAGVRFDVEVTSDQPHRRYSEIRQLISDSALHDNPKTAALHMFDILAQAEAKVHGVSKEDVHFHEVGAVDSIVDIVGVAVGIHALGIDKIICSALPVNRGSVLTAHGVLPTPAPATMELLSGVPIVGVESPIELVTPTGAAIVRGLASEFGGYPSFTPVGIGYGLGRSDPAGLPNALRVVIGRQASEVLGRDRVGVLECQVDDMDSRMLGHLMDLLPAKGALDVTFSAVQMKKNRPGILITVLVPVDRMHEAAFILLTHTTTLGVRTSFSERWVLDRRSEDADTSMGPVRVKVVSLPDGRIERRCEFEDVRSIALRTGRSPREILQVLDRELNY